MQIKVYGVKLVPCSTVSWNDLWREIEAHSVKQIAALKKFLEEDGSPVSPLLMDKQMIVSQTYEGTYKGGIVIKIKDVKSYFRVDSKGGGLKVSSLDLEDGERHIEINFFLVRTDSGKGLYAYYHQSSHMNDFCGLIRNAHERLLEKERLRLQAECDSGAITLRELKLKRADLKPMTYEIMARNGDASSLVRGLSRIKKLKIVFSDWKGQTAGDMSPLVPLAKNVTTEMSFEADTNLGSLKDLLVGIIKSDKAKRLRVEGTDPEALDQVINLEKNLDDFSRTDYDAFARETREVDLSNLSDSWTKSAALKWLKKTAESPHVVKRLQ